MKQLYMLVPFAPVHYRGIQTPHACSGNERGSPQGEANEARIHTLPPLLSVPVSYWWTQEFCALRRGSTAMGRKVKEAGGEEMKVLQHDRRRGAWSELVRLNANAALWPLNH